MISLLPARRRAEEFAALVDGAGDGTVGGAGAAGGSAHVQERHGELLEVVGALRDVETPEPRPEFVSDLRSRLMAEADTALSETSRRLTLPARRHSRRERRIAVVAGTAALLGATTSVAVASQGSLPGDTLYPVKRAVEGLHTTLTIDDGARARTVLEQASGRLSEVESLARRVDPQQDDRVPATLDDFSAKAEQGADLVLDEYADNGDVALVNRLRNFVDTSMAKLVDLDALLPSSATTSLNKAATVLSQINDRILEACPECDGTALEVPDRLVAAQRTIDTTPQVTPRQQEEPRIGGQEPLDPDDVVDVPDQQPTGSPTDRGKQHKDRGNAGQTQDDPVKKATKPVEKTVDNTVNGLDKTLRTGNRVLLGEDDGVLGPLLDPLLDPLLGKNGLLSD